MLCGACNQDRHPVIEGDQSGRFVYTCGNGECHSFIKLHERSEPKPLNEALAPVSVYTPPTPVVTPSAPVIAAPDTVDNAMSAIEARLAIVEATLATMPALKAERAKLIRLQNAARPRIRVTVDPKLRQAALRHAAKDTQ